MRGMTSLVLGLGLVACGGEAPLTPAPPPPPPPPPPPSAFRFVASLPIPPQYGVHDLFVRDGLAFVCAWNSGLIIYDVGNGLRGGTPAAPREVSRIVPPARNPSNQPRVHNAWWYWSPGGERRYVFVGEEGPGTIGASSSGAINVIDVSDLANPRLVAFYSAPAGEAAGTHNFWVDEAAGILYAAYYNKGVVAFDIAGTLAGDLASRVLAERLPGGAGSTYTWGVMRAGTSLYASDMLAGLVQLDLARRGDPTSLQVLGGGGNAADRYGADLWVRGSTAYLGTWGFQPRVPGVRGNQLRIFALGPTGAPALVDSVTIAGVTTIGDVEVSPDGQWLLLPTETSGSGAQSSPTNVYSLADPRRPVLQGSVSIEGGVHTATFGQVGNRLYAFLSKNPPEPAVVVYEVVAP